MGSTHSSPTVDIVRPHYPLFNHLCKKIADTSGESIDHVCKHLAQHVIWEKLDKLDPVVAAIFCNSFLDYQHVYNVTHEMEKWLDMGLHKQVYHYRYKLDLTLIYQLNWTEAKVKEADTNFVLVVPFEKGGLDGFICLQLTQTEAPSNETCSPQ